VNIEYNAPKTIGDLLERYNNGERYFPNCDFSFHTNLLFLELEDVILNNSFFDSANFSHSNFKNASLKNCNFKCCLFEDVNLENANLEGSLICAATFIDSNIRGANFNKVEYYGHILSHTDFINAFGKQNKD
jgi:uncharacterized protein YjbI with pentapeptide repeats